MINQIIAECDNVKIDIEDDGSVVIYHKDQDAINKAVERINEICREAKPGEVYEGKVVRIEKFGAFVNLFGKTDGLLHISKMCKGRLDKVEDVLNMGDTVAVVVDEIDDKGKISVSCVTPFPLPEKSGSDERPARGRGDRDHDRDHGRGDHRGPRRNGAFKVSDKKAVHRSSPKKEEEQKAAEAAPSEPVPAAPAAETAENE